MKVAALAVFIVFYSLFVLPPSVFADTSGEKTFHEKGCAKCHTVKAYGINGGKKLMESPDLSDVGLKHDSEFLVKYLRKKIKLNGKKHLKRFKGSKEEYKELEKWLLSLKTPLAQ